MMLWLLFGQKIVKNVATVYSIFWSLAKLSLNFIYFFGHFIEGSKEQSLCKEKFHCMTDLLFDWFGFG